MKLEKELAKVGIHPICEISYGEKMNIARQAATKIAGAFSCLQNQYSEILIRLSNCKMYLAEIENPAEKVNYFYKDKAIYFNKEVDYQKIGEATLHECLHFLQDSRNINGELNRLGLCRFSEFRVSGLGLNEGATQYIASVANGGECHKAIRSGDSFFTFYTVNENYYPLLTSIFKQLLVLLGEERLIESTVNGRADFNDYFLNLFEENTNKLLTKMDDLMEMENAQKEIPEEAKILTYLDIQDLILTTYFSKASKYADTLEEIEQEKGKLENLQKILGKTDNKNSEAICEEMNRTLNHRYIQISRQKSKNSLVVFYQSKIMKFLQRILSYLGEK